MKRLIFVFLISAALQAHADVRMDTQTYDKSRVYNVYFETGRATLIQFEADEKLDSAGSILGMGDAAAWNLGIRGNNISFKPTQKAPQTNIVIATNKRTYAFDLLPATKANHPTYLLTFIYPDTLAAAEAARVAAAAKRAQQLASTKDDKVVINTDYAWRGSNQLLKPTAAWDDGRFTRLVYDHAGELPVFFKVLPDGSEALVNSNIDPVDKNTVVLQEVARVVRVRLADEVGEVINSRYAVPKFNSNGAGMPGTVRTLKQEAVLIPEATAVATPIAMPAASKELQ